MAKNRQAAVIAVTCACAGAIAVATADGRSLGSARVNTSTFSSQTFEKALQATRTRWFQTHLRCTKASFLLLYKAVYEAWTRKPRPNTTPPHHQASSSYYDLPDPRKQHGFCSCDYGYFAHARCGVHQ
ncbi:hypothetical protein PR003_g17658 [Phytophthora rubi]|uniref:Uncharacterized protein n=1 Tax=Phytophthora rubi TaxID=129364 RepID=A0A6A4EC80_9STRA|nr:hypothetical protein PR003_g17658 [Phytophthora rubi]